MPESLPALVSAAAAIVVTLTVYLAAERLHRRTGWFILNPVLVSVAALIVALLALRIDYASYERGGRILAWLLGPAVVALGVPLAERWDEIVRHGRAIFGSILAGSVTGIVSAAGVARLLGATPEVVRSLAPRSVTTPIAMGISAKVGGIPSLTAALVIATGVLGAVAGPALLRRLGVRSRTAVGLALGAAAHGIGTARAVEEGDVEGATAGLAIGLMGVATAVLAPIILLLFF